MDYSYLAGIIVLVIVLIIVGVIVHDYIRSSIWFTFIDKRTKLCRRCGSKHFKKAYYGTYYWEKAQKNECDCTYFL